MNNSSDQILKKEVYCPRCGEEIEAQVVLNSFCCGYRITASCKNGCQWTEEEQAEVSREADEALVSA